MNVTRRDFLRTGAAAAATLLTPNALESAMMNDKPDKPDKLLWANLLHLGYNMWGDTPRAYTPRTDKLRCEDALWVELTEKMAAAGMNMVVIDLGEGVKYESHPELAIEGSWSVEKLRKDLLRLRQLGLEPIPKLNFSTGHDVWLGEYERMVSTKTYYRVCAELIKEVCGIFDKPRFFHLGYDEETAGHQKSYDYCCIRQGELWWHDFLFFVQTVEAQGVRPWIWADYYWRNQESFLQRMPKSVLQSNWYYGESFDLEKVTPDKVNAVKAYVDLDKAGFEQVPTGSNWSNNTNFKGTADFCRRHVDPARLKGFLMADWRPTTAAYRDHHLAAIQQIKQVKDAMG